MTQVDIFVNWELDAIDRLRDDVPSCLLERVEEARRAGRSGFLPNGKMSDEETYLAAASLSLESVIHQLNAVVDWMLLALASRILPPKWATTRKAHTRSRSSLSKAIEDHYNDLPGWNEIQLLGEDANALNHRGGSHLPEPTPLGIPMFRHADTTIETLRVRCAGTWAWLQAIWRATEVASRDDA